MGILSTRFSGSRQPPHRRFRAAPAGERGEIRRVIRGIYDYPRFSKLLDQHLSPDIDQVARALARKFRWRIQPSGATALNFLGLSTQVPARAVYLSDGPDRAYQVGNTPLVFEHTALKESGIQAEGEWTDRPGAQIARPGADHARDHRQDSGVAAEAAARQSPGRYENGDGLGLQHNSTNRRRGSDMDRIAAGSATDRRDLFGESASRLGMNPAIVEKDFWVCWILKHLFAEPRSRIRWSSRAEPACPRSSG